MDSLDIKDTIVSVDALNCQTEIADKIVSKGGDYLFCVKSNQEKLHSRIEERFENMSNVDKKTNPKALRKKEN
ncbi:MAG: ISAs1 family transposase [Bacteriovoracaceae bacterium]|nr:ISAs1 family transposase [Bacteriovoracaceae bacterium]